MLIFKGVDLNSVFYRACKFFEKNLSVNSGFLASSSVCIERDIRIVSQ